MKRRALLVLGLLLPLTALAYTSPGKPTGFVNDFAGLLSPREEAFLEQKLRNFQKESSNEVAVVTIESLEGDTIESYAVELFEEWGIGRKETDNGLLILAAEKDRAVRIEVGYGLEGELTDAESFWIIENRIKPAFREERYFEGLDRATDGVIKAVGGELETPQKNSASWSELISTIIFIILFLGLRFLIWKRGGPFVWWGGGRSSGFGGFGGGGSGGGGSSGRW